MNAENCQCFEDVVKPINLGVPVIPSPGFVYFGEDEQLKLCDTARRYCTCIHEAGHAVFAEYFECYVGASGVWVSDDYGGLCTYEGVSDDPATVALLALAGLICQWEWLSPGSQLGATSWGSADYTRHLVINAADGGSASDSAIAQRLSIRLHPLDPDALLSQWIFHSRDVLRTKSIWSSVIAVANCLYFRSILSPQQVGSIMNGVVAAEAALHLTPPKTGPISLKNLVFVSK